MADKSFFGRLQKLFSTSSIIRDPKTNKIKVIDVNKIQAYNNLESNRAVDNYIGIRGGTVGGMGYDPSYGFQLLKTDLYRNYENMCQDSIIAAAVDIFADESTLQNEFGEVLKINSSKDYIKESLDNLFYDILNIEFNLWPWVHNLVKYGDMYLKLDIVENLGVTNVIPLSPYYVTRVEDPNNPDSVIFQYDSTDGMYTRKSKTHFENYEVAHFRLLSDTNFLPYGRSMLEPARKVWSQLSLMEDAMILHRIMRAPERRIFKIDIGNIPPHEVDNHMNQIIERMKKVPYMDETTGNYNLKFNIQNMLEDYYLPVRGGQSGTEIDSLPGMEWNGIEDVNYLKNKMFAALKVPKAFLNFEEDVNSKCLIGSTKILLNDGNIKTIEEISKLFENNNDPNLFTCTYDIQSNRIIESKIVLAEKTRLDATLIEILTYNNDSIISTPDHKFILKDGVEIEAQNLKENDCLLSDPCISQIVKSVTLLDYTMDNFNMEVDDENHNFLLANGIFIKNSTLAAEDVRFSRTVERLQRIIVSELTKIAIVHLYSQGYTNEDLVDFELSLTNSSTVRELEKLELWDKRFDMASRAKELGLLPSDFIYEHLLEISEDQQIDFKDKIIEDAKEFFRLEQIKMQGNDPAMTSESYGTQQDLNQQKESKKNGVYDEDEHERKKHDARYKTLSKTQNRFNDTSLTKVSKTDKSLKHNYRGGSPLAQEGIIKKLSKSKIKRGNLKNNSGIISEENTNMNKNEDRNTFLDENNLIS